MKVLVCGSQTQIIYCNVKSTPEFISSHNYKFYLTFLT